MSNLVQKVVKKVSRRDGAALERPELLRRVRARERRRDRASDPLTPEERSIQQANAKRLTGGTRRLLSLARGRGPASAALIMAATASWAIIASTAFLWPVQAIMAVISIGGLGTLTVLETEWVGYLDLFGWVSSWGQEMLFISLIIVFIIGFLVMLTAIFVYTIRGINISNDLSILIMAICLALYAVPVFNLLPWMWFWCLYVVKSQTDG